MADIGPGRWHILFNNNTGNHHVLSVASDAGREQLAEVTAPGAEYTYISNHPNRLAAQKAIKDIRTQRKQQSQ